VGDAGTHSGFATVTHNIAERLMVDHGHDISVLAVNHRGDFWPTPLKLYPANLKVPTDVQGFSRYVELLAATVPDAVVFVNDPHVVLHALLDNKYDSEHIFWQGFETGGSFYKPPILAYLPVDGYDSPKSWDILKQRVTRIAMTKFGQTAMPEAPVIWHGVDTSVFKPMDKREAKKIIGYDPDRFLVLRVDKNSIRKDYPATWKAMRPLLRKYRDIDLHYHCLPRAFDGHDLRASMFNDEDVRDRVNFSPNIDGFRGWPDEQLAVLYNAADLFVSTSWGEGFGLTPLQAMACGTPVVAQNCSAITEVVGPGGVVVEPAGRITTPMGQDQCLPDIDGFTREIEHLYLAGGVRRKLAKAAIEHASQFSWDIAATRINDILEREVVNAVSERSRPTEIHPVEVPG
jgi:glycosyltransferase involved in cell wall biosynthesis